jgi:hypothetical protein
VMVGGVPRRREQLRLELHVEPVVHFAQTIDELGLER